MMLVISIVNHVPFARHRQVNVPIRELHFASSLIHLDVCGPSHATIFWELIGLLPL